MYSYQFEFKDRKIDNFFKRASVVAELSPDEQTKVGAILVDPVAGTVINSGYNGFCRGAPDHIIPKSRPHKHDFILHAETNLILNCARMGIKTSGGILFCTLSPCVWCLRQIYQAGIETVFFTEKYREFSKNLEMKDLFVTVEGCETTSGLKYHILGISGGLPQ